VTVPIRFSSALRARRVVDDGVTVLPVAVEVAAVIDGVAILVNILNNTVLILWLLVQKFSM
jgi:hypothetical protein